MTDQQIIAAFRAGTLQIDCVAMSLVQNGAGDKAISYVGNGYIRQTENDRLSFKLYAGETRNTNLVQDFNKLGHVKSGSIYEDSEFYTLTATAADGTRWSANHVLPQPSWHFERPNPIVEGTLAQCVRGQQAIASTTKLRLHYFEKADLPVMMDKATFTAAGVTFTVEGMDSGFFMAADSSSPLPEHFHTPT